MNLARAVADPRTTRFYALTDWMARIGCCVTCRTWMAVSIVEREEGKHSCPLPPIPCCAPEYRRGRCESYVRDEWARRPAA